MLITRGYLWDAGPTLVDNWTISNRAGTENHVADLEPTWSYSNCLAQLKTSSNSTGPTGLVADMSTTISTKTSKTCFVKTNLGKREQLKRWQYWGTLPPWMTRYRGSMSRDVKTRDIGDQLETEELWQAPCDSGIMARTLLLSWKI